MPVLNNIVSENLSAVLVFLLVWLVALSFFFIKIHLFFKKLTHGISVSGLESILKEHLKRIEIISKKVADLEKRCDDIEKVGLLHLQKVGLVRFNPFADAGGDQSFTLSILNDRGDGVVVSSLHGRDQTRIYAKPVKAGEGTKYELSREEKEAITRALKEKHA